MKTTKMIKLYTTGLLFLVSLSTYSQANLLVNGGFEGAIGADNLPASWFNFEPQTTTNLSLVTNATDPTATFEGTKALKVAYDPSTNVNGSVQQTVTGIQAGSIYDVSYWYKYSDPIAVGSIGVSALQWLSPTDDDVAPVPADEGFFFGQECPTTAQGVFLPLNFSVTAPAGASKLFINLSCVGAIRNFIFDDVKIVKRTVLGISEVDSKQLNIYTQGDTAYVATQGGEQIGVYNLLGQKITGVTGDEKVTVLSNLTKNQVLIVRVDNKSTKIVLQ
jgi:hypothetical protein